ncbi:type II toxin-antitoxin system RelE family toxin [Halovenus halobia]|uniref:type II toxin-antitoxin system RelE family toxin n=1 Tax=Halovenus halobia TaxID=3396622 RepID=UPI003F568FB8
MSYNILLDESAREYLVSLDDKSQRIVKDNLSKLAEEPYPKPGAGQGDREQLTIEGEEMYRLHIGRTHTAFYIIREDLQEVRVLELMDIDEAHKRYGE